MKIAFTICSNNYWSQAKTLFDSLADTNPDYTLVCGLVDKVHKSIDYSIKNKNIRVVEVASLGIPKDYNVFTKYNIIELNTSVKASYIKWIKNNYPDVEVILYFDPDIKIFSSLREIEVELKNSSIVLTPHIYKPIPTDLVNPNESKFLNYGIYNLGFIGISFNNQEVYDFIDWWEDKLMKQCFIDVCNGVFVDQLFINHVPIFFHKITKVLFNYGANVAPWNLHEREISLKDGEYFVNNVKLMFFHFSNIHFKKGKHPIYNRYDLYPVLEELHENYRTELKNNNYFMLKTLSCYYKTRPLKRSILIKFLNWMSPPIFTKFIKKYVFKK